MKQNIYGIFLLASIVCVLSFVGCTPEEEKDVETVVEDGVELIVDAYVPVAAPIVHEIVTDLQKTETAGT